MKFQKVLAAALFSIMAAFSVASAQEDIVIDFYYPIAVDGPLTDVIDGYAETFEAANPGIDIVPTYTGSYIQTREVILTEGMDPIVDVAVLLAIDLLTFVEEGAIVPVDEWVSEEQLNDTFDSLWENSVDEEGVLWSVPFQRSTPILYYNADMLAEAGYTEAPMNKEEMLEIAQALTTEDRAGLLVPVAGTFPIWMFESFANAHGQPITLSGEPTSVYLNTPEALEAVTFLTNLGTEYGVGPAGGSAWGDTPTAFLAGDAAMIYHTTGSMTSILNNADFEVGVAFTPSGPAGEDGTGFGTPTGGGNLYVFDNPSAPKSQEELDAAWAWVEYISSPEVQSDWGAASGYIAARQSAWDIDPLASRVAEFPQYTTTRDQLEVASMEFSSYRTVDVQNIINGVLGEIISGNTALEDAGTALEEAQAQIDSLLEEYR